MMRNELHDEDEIVVKGQIVDIYLRRIYPGSVYIKDGKIDMIIEESVDELSYILPGFVDSHVHIESSMLTPSHFGHTAVRHGTLGVVADPHEIANVCGMPGIEYMVNNAKKSPIPIYFTAPSCVPATEWDHSGAQLDSSHMEMLLSRSEFVGLGEMMDYPGVLAHRESVCSKLRVAQKYHKPIDGHMPHGSAEDVLQYIHAGISTDHECETLDDARQKARSGMMIQMREGSAAKNLNRLLPLIKEFPEKVMFCTDDFKVGDLVKGHINHLVKRAVEKGYDIYDVIRAASWNPVNHYHLDLGLLSEGDSADFIVVEDLDDFQVQEVWLRGQCVELTQEGAHEREIINHFNAKPVRDEDLLAPLSEGGHIHVIEVQDGSLVTEHRYYPWSEDIVEEHQLNQVAVINRYAESQRPSLAWVQGFGIREGAVACSIAHDSHHIIAVGASESDMRQAINVLIEHRGGAVVVYRDETVVLPLPIAGLISPLPSNELNQHWGAFEGMLRKLGMRLQSPLLTLSFLSLPVIPHLRLTDIGLFDVDQMSYINQSSCN